MSDTKNPSTANHIHTTTTASITPWGESEERIIGASEYIELHDGKQHEGSRAFSDGKGVPSSNIMRTVSIEATTVNAETSV